MATAARLGGEVLNTTQSIGHILHTGQDLGNQAFANNGSDGDAGTSEFGIPFGKKILYQTIAILLTLIVVYITFALFHYSWGKSECRAKHRRSQSSMKVDATGRRMTTTNNNSCTSDSSTSHSTTAGRSKEVAARNSRVLRIMCIVGSIFTLGRLASEQIEILPARNERADCRHYQIAMVVTYALAITTLYIVLWYRVRVFLSHPAMRHLGSRVLNVIAFIAFGIIIAASAVNMTLFLATTVSTDGVGGCVVISPENFLSNDARFAILTVSTVLSQASLLGLFLYPLVRHSVSMQSTNKSNKPKTIANGSLKKLRPSSALSPVPVTSGTWRRRGSSRRKKRELALLKIIKRVMLTATVCAVSDIVSGLVVRLVKEEPRVVTNLIFDVNIVINLISVLMSFKDWRVRMFPCCPNAKKGNRYSDTGTLQRKIVKERNNYTGPGYTSSPAVFSSHDSSATQGMYPTSDSGMLSPSPKEKRFNFDVATQKNELGSTDQLENPT